MRVMIVDDSIVFRSQIKAALEGVAGLTVMGSASNGKIALDFIELNPCDLLILDLEMPVLNGLETLAELKRRNLPQKVIVFAAPTQDGARQVFDAFNLGAVDFIAKPASPKSLEEALIGIKRDLIPKILQFVKLQSPRALAAPLQQKKVNLDHLPLSSATKDFYVKVNLEQFKPRIIAIGCSTGGPLALETIFSTLKDRALTLPILIVQHMPPHFTECLAKRLESLSGIPAAEGRDGEPIQSGRIYIAPGDYHMSVRRKPDGTEVIIKLDQGEKRCYVRPSVDNLFESVAQAYGATTAGFILTGMGDDGCSGAKAIKQAAGAVMIQNSDSSVVWGMPGAVFAAHAFDGMGDLSECSRLIRQMAT